jgi:hypothetical protein
MAHTAVKLPRSGFFPILFWVLKREPWRFFNLALGLAVSLLSALVFIAITNHFPEAVSTIHIPPSTFFDWLFLSSIGLITLGAMDQLLIYSLSLRLAWGVFLSLLIRVALYLAVEFIFWPVRIFFAWIGQWGPLYGIIHFFNRLFNYSIFSPISVWEWIRDIIAGILFLMFIVMIIVGYIVGPEAEDPNLRLGLFVPILVRKYKKAKAANKLTLADEYLKKARELYNGAIQEARQKAEEAGEEMVSSAFEDALGL